MPLSLRTRTPDPGWARVFDGRDHPAPQPTIAVDEPTGEHHDGDPSTDQIRAAPHDPALTWLLAHHDRQPPIDVMGPRMHEQFQEVINALETDARVKVVVFDGAVDGFFLNHSDFRAKLEDLVENHRGYHVGRPARD